MSESHSPLNMEGKEVNQVKMFEYLGVVLDECLSFNDHINLHVKGQKLPAGLASCPAYEVV